MVQKRTPKLDALMARIRRLTSADGAKPALAEDLGVRVGQLYDWLAGRYEPGGEVAIQLQDWADAEESKPKKKTPSVLVARPAPKAKTKKDTTNAKLSKDRRKT